MLNKAELRDFKEKPAGGDAMINGGFFVLNSRVFKYLSNDSTVWERDPLVNLTKDNQLMAYEHHGFWQPMDTLRDRNLLENLWKDSCAPWKKWD